MNFLEALGNSNGGEFFSRLQNSANRRDDFVICNFHTSFIVFQKKIPEKKVKKERNVNPGKTATEAELSEAWSWD